MLLVILIGFSAFLVTTWVMAGYNVLAGNPVNLEYLVCATIIAGLAIFVECMIALIRRKLRQRKDRKFKEYLETIKR